MLSSNKAEYWAAHYIRRHGIDFYDAGLIFEHPILVKSDSRKDYGEKRLVGLGIEAEGRIHQLIRSQKYKMFPA